MKTIEIIKTIKAYEQELWAAYVEMRDAFGSLDEATQRAFREWMAIDVLLTRLNLKDEQ